MDNSNQAALDAAKREARRALAAHVNIRTAEREARLRDVARLIYGRKLWWRDAAGKHYVMVRDVRIIGGLVLVGGLGAGYAAVTAPLFNTYADNDSWYREREEREERKRIAATEQRTKMSDVDRLDRAKQAALLYNAASVYSIVGDEPRALALSLCREALSGLTVRHVSQQAGAFVTPSLVQPRGNHVFVLGIGPVANLALLEDFSTGESEVSEAKEKTEQPVSVHEVLVIPGGRAQVLVHGDRTYSAKFTAASENDLRALLIDVAARDYAPDQTPLKRALAVQDAYKLLQGRGTLDSELAEALQQRAGELLNFRHARGVSAEGLIVGGVFEGDALLVTIQNDRGKTSREWLSNLTLA